MNRKIAAAIALLDSNHPGEVAAAAAAIKRLLAAEHKTLGDFAEIVENLGKKKTKQSDDTGELTAVRKRLKEVLDENELFKQENIRLKEEAKGLRTTIQQMQKAIHDLQNNRGPFTNIQIANMDGIVHAITRFVGQDFMTPSEFILIGNLQFGTDEGKLGRGKKTWRREVADFLGADYYQVNKWIEGKEMIPFDIARKMRNLMARQTINTYNK